ncbi:MAG TPA: ABC transporter ATP-binding protein [Burkholderiaceae bacterium]|nr:ABC transporter ATP-binding protein [Burkholderiaceae bacterium]
MMMTTPVLQASDLSLSYGQVQVLKDVSLALMPGERHALIGTNGAGKTSLINVLTGALSPGSGQVCLAGADVTRAPADERARQGLQRTFQINSLFPQLSAHESVAMAISQRRGLGGRWWRPLSCYGSVTDEAAVLLQNTGMTDFADQPVGTLAYGQQRLVELALALARRPRVLLLDEPAAGLPAAEGAALLNLLESLSGEMAVLLVEHDMKLVFSFAQRVSVLAQGRVLASGPAAAIRNDPVVQEAYLGSAVR